MNCILRMLLLLAVSAQRSTVVPVLQAMELVIVKSEGNTIAATAVVSVRICG